MAAADAQSNPVVAKRKAHVLEDDAGSDVDAAAPAKRFKHACDQCEYSTAISSSFTTHMRTHTGVKPYVCKTCRQGFSQSGALTRHERTHSGVKPYVCETCEKAFTTSGGLTTHERTHSGDKPYVCETCEKAFTTSGGLTTHKRTHSGAKPYVCEMCGKAFAESGSLTVHKRTHSGAKPYVCSICGKGFARSGDLTVHERTHSGAKPYVCETCSQGFSQNHSLQEHFQRHHTARGMQRRKKEEERLQRWFEAQGLAFDRELRVDFQCALGADRAQRWANIDFVHHRADGVAFFVEVDEREHSSEGYSLSCETRRMTDVYSSIVTAQPDLKHLVWIRYNPDAYDLNGARHKVLKRDRETFVLDTIRHYQPTMPMEVLYLFYSARSVTDTPTTTPTASSNRTPGDNKSAADAANLQVDAASTPTPTPTSALQHWRPLVFDMPDFPAALLPLSRMLHPSSPAASATFFASAAFALA